MANIAPNTKRERITWQRGQQAEFRCMFQKKDGSPLLPLDAARFPNYSIYSPSGIQVQTGVAQSFGNPGGYRVLWQVPVDCELSNDTASWMLEVSFVDEKKKQYQLHQDFNVVEKQITSQENRDLIRLGVEAAPFRTNWRGDNVPYSIAVSCFKSDAPDDATQAPFPVAVTPTGPIIEGDSIAYTIDVPAGVLKPGMYTFLWNVQETASSATEIEFQQLRVIPLKLLQMIPQVKFIVGRFQAAFDLPNYISDADYAEGLAHGIEYINQWHPISFYSYGDMMTTNGVTSPLSSFWLMASAWWVLHSQHLVEAGLAFSMCLEEDTLIATSRGLVKIKHLESGRRVSDIHKKLSFYEFSQDELEYLKKLVDDRALNGLTYTADDIIDAFGIDERNNTLSRNLTRLGLDDFRADTNPRTWAIWRPFYDELSTKLGIPSTGNIKFSTEHVLDTPIGRQQPKYVWNLGKKETILVVTEIGYSIEGTHDHVVPVLTCDLELKELKLSEVEPSNYLMIKKHGFDEDSDWDVDLTEAISIVESRPAATKSESAAIYDKYPLPSKMSVSLARVLGYMISEGWLCRKNYTFGFCNTDDVLIADFQKHWKRVFGFKLPEKTTTNYITSTGKYCRYFGMANSRIFKFLVAIGFSEYQAPDKEVPWSILEAPKKYVRHFIQTYFEGDGCYHAHEKIEYTKRVALFSSSSNKLRQHIQQLLLRFGIISFNKYREDATVYSVIVRGADLDRYAEVIGFWYKGKEHTSTGVYYTQTTGVPWFVLDIIKEFSSGTNGRGWVKLKDGTHVRCQLGQTCRDPKHPDWTKWYDSNQKTISLERFKAYFEFNGELIKQLFPKQYLKLKRYYDICDKYVFSPVIMWEDGRRGNVYDPSLPGSDDFWSHYFYANGIVTHNSGASVSLDYDRTSPIESAIGRLREEFSQNLTPAKISYGRIKNGIGRLSVRPAQLRSFQNRLFKFESTPGLGTNSQIMTMLTTMGIAP